MAAVLIDIVEGRSQQAETARQTMAAVKRTPETDYFVHSTAVVDDGAVIGKGTKIWHFSHIMKGAKIGESCNFGQNVNVDGGTRIGNNVKGNEYVGKAFGFPSPESAWGNSAD